MTGTYPQLKLSNVTAAASAIGAVRDVRLKNLIGARSYLTRDKLQTSEMETDIEDEGVDVKGLLRKSSRHGSWTREGVMGGNRQRGHDDEELVEVDLEGDERENEVIDNVYQVQESQEKNLDEAGREQDVEGQSVEEDAFNESCEEEDGFGMIINSITYFELQ
ncbi:hypothetical protein EDD11_005572 [Mortierella claussenii]|nr:hypothetical protein EDD11_005572 [Mortierella claussenii]